MKFGGLLSLPLVQVMLLPVGRVIVGLLWAGRWVCLLSGVTFEPCHVLLWAWQESKVRRRQLMRQTTAPVMGVVVWRRCCPSHTGYEVGGVVEWPCVMCVHCGGCVFITHAQGVKQSVCRCRCRRRPHKNRWFRISGHLYVTRYRRKTGSCTAY